MRTATLSLSQIYYQKMQNLQISENHLSFVTEFIQHTFNDAIVRNVSDIHFEPHREHLRIRFRIDGILSEICRAPIFIIPTLIAHIKIRAKLDIAEKRIPQDGRFEIVTDQQIHCDFRISTCPTIFGEKIVARLLPSHSALFSIAELGMNTIEQATFLSAIHKPQGLILITGPTGSGKTTTLYAALSLLNSTTRNISTIEDPVEIAISGINQLNVNHKIGLDFSHALRALLRQDPDVIMIGEIRDSETADLAMRAAQTGHLVFATLHTNDALETLTRLKMLGVNIEDLANSLLLILAQRLVRKLCSHCKMLDVRTNNHYIANQCEQCHDGYHQRTGVYELFPITDETKLMLLKYKHPAFIKMQTQFIPLKQAGFAKVQQGITSVSEIFRVIG